MVATIDNWYSYFHCKIMNKCEYQLSMVATIDNWYSYFHCKIIHKG